jgi:putative transposase
MCWRFRARLGIGVGGAVFLFLPPRVRIGVRRALSESEQSAVLACLHEERFQDCSPAQVYAALIGEGRFHCSIHTVYRLLEAGGQNRERRDQLTHPPCQMATEADQLWGWNITKLRGPVKWTANHLNVILHVFSRCVVGWMIAYGESAELPSA